MSRSGIRLRGLIKEFQLVISFSRLGSPSLSDDTSQTTLAPTKTERDVEEDLLRTFTATRGIVLAMYSAQNIDRLVTMFRASKRSGRTRVACPR